MKFLVRLLFVFLLAVTSVSAQTISVLYTTDVHGAIFPYNFTENSPVSFSMSQAYSYIKSVRDTSRNVILLDGGDFLQGTPATYYYNYVDNHSSHIISKLYNFMKADAVVVGNHDIEAGHQVYDKIHSELEMPWLAANIINKKTGEPYFTPYTVIERSGKRIAIIGLTTPYIPHWLPEYLWQDMQFEDMIESAAKWIKIVREKEHPDAVIGLFHSGYDYTYGNQTADTPMNENASVLVAQRVDGFNAILLGHDHKLYNRVVNSPDGSEVTILDAGTAARNLGSLAITFDAKGKPHCQAKIIALSNTDESKEFNDFFRAHYYAIKAYTQKVVGTVVKNIDSKESLFGNSVFVDMVHKSMLRHTGADISFSAPLLMGVEIPVGELTVGRMFNIYKFENMLNVISLTGKEVKDYLEYSYDLWITNPSTEGHLIKVNNRGRLINKFYNFDSAAGIVYNVNPFKDKGSRVEIVSMTDGTPFDVNKTYKVALNSYRFNGGGGHLEHGVGLSKQQIEERRVEEVRRDLRGILLDDIIEKGSVGDEQMDNWKFVPQADVESFIKADMEQLNIR